MIYTKTGDAGTTSLIGGTRVSKCHPRVEAYGTVDELGAQVALLAEMMECEDSPALKSPRAPYCAILHEVQRQLFTIQTLLAIEPDAPKQLPFDIAAYSAELTSHCAVLEHSIDELQSSLPPLRSFVIPGGNTMSAQSHVARTVCRRAERRIVELYSTDSASANPAVSAYINRLSDFLFVLARHLVVSQGDKECFL